MATKNVSLKPRIFVPSYEGHAISNAIIHKFREILTRKETKIDTAGRKKIKQELSLLMRQKSSNLLCPTKIGDAIDDIIDEYVETILNGVKDHSFAYLILDRLVRRIECEVLSINRMSK